MRPAVLSVNSMEDSPVRRYVVVSILTSVNCSSANCGQSAWTQITSTDLNQLYQGVSSFSVVLEKQFLSMCTHTHTLTVSLCVNWLL